MNVLIEPKLIIGGPLLYLDQRRGAVGFFLSIGYPLNSVFNKSIGVMDSNGNSVGQISSFRYFSFQAGLSYAFEILTEDDHRPTPSF